MKVARSGLVAMALVMTTCALGRPEKARGELQWQWPRKESLHLRIVALAWNHPRSSFFASEEVFVAEKQLNKEEGQLVKLVYDFLPYQPRLSETGLDYATVHELRAVRDSSCDETLAEILSGHVGDWRQQQPPQVTYSLAAPALNPSRHRRQLPCYVTSAEDYSRAQHEPVPGSEQ